MYIHPVSRSKHWVPDFTDSTQDRPQIGWLIGWSHAAWRIVAVNDRKEDLWSDREREIVEAKGREYAPVHVILRPPHMDSEDPVRLRSRDKSVSAIPGLTKWWVYRDEHYPVCGKCGEPRPCRQVVADAVVAREMATMKRYEMAGICPACEQAVTRRQKTMTFEDNIVIPGGPPLTFHTRGRCHGELISYERRWVEADPETRHTTLSCEGWVTHHGDGTYECTALEKCPGFNVLHYGGYRRCSCPECHAKGLFTCEPRTGARRRS